MMTGQAGNFARVIVPSPLKEPLTYKVSNDLRHQIVAGMRVLIPLGKRKLTGIVLDLFDKTRLAETKEIIAVQDERPILDATLLQLSQWMAQYYLATLGEVIATILPPSLKSETQRTVIAKVDTSSVSGPFETKILEALRQKNGKIGIKSLMRMIPGNAVHRALERLESIGAIEIRERLPGQRPRHREVCVDSSPPSFEGRLILTTEQETVIQTIEQRLERGGFESFLLHGVTGSGKTEVYLRAMERVREAGRRSLILIPEISLTPQLIDRLNERFPGRVGILHSALTASERWSQWWQIVRGNVDVVVGARSAVFAPVPGLGLIVVDEEHDPSYKQEEGLRYNGRDVAVMRGKLSDCPVILGSATPAIESYYNCLQGRYRLLEMTRRVQQRSLPCIKVIDLRAERKPPSPQLGSHKSSQAKDAIRSESTDRPLISDCFADLLRENHKSSRQSLIFLNRRGFSNFLQCAVCGYVLRCSHCSVTLTHHLRQQSLCCHHCNFRRPISQLCPACGQLKLSGVGVGTEQMEQAVRLLVPQARVSRMDRDTTSKRGSHEGFIRRWQKGEIDILVGTQMITKGHDVMGVTLVGALLADLSLNLPDFRAAERTFQLLSQVAGRAGRGEDPGRVIIQTYTPDHYAIQYLAQHDYKGFFASEIEFRRALNYPPFSRLINLRIEGPKSDEVEAKAKGLARALRQKQSRAIESRDSIEILGPAPAPIHKLRNRYRWQLLLKGKQISGLLDLASRACEMVPRSRLMRLHVDVDPYNML